MDDNGKKLLFWERLRALLLIAILAVLVVTAAGVLRFTRQINGSTLTNVIQRLDTLTTQLEAVDWEGLVSAVNGVSSRLQEEDVEEMITSLQELTTQLRQVDWAGLAENANDMAVQARDSLERAEEAMEKVSEALDSLDMEALNTAITDLQKVVEPLATFARRFG